MEDLYNLVDSILSTVYENKDAYKESPIPVYDVRIIDIKKGKEIIEQYFDLHDMRYEPFYGLTSGQIEEVVLRKLREHNEEVLLEADQRVLRQFMTESNTIDYKKLRDVVMDDYGEVTISKELLEYLNNKYGLFNNMSKEDYLNLCKSVTVTYDGVDYDVKAIFDFFVERINPEFLKDDGFVKEILDCYIVRRTADEEYDFYNFEFASPVYTSFVLRLSEAQREKFSPIISKISSDLAWKISSGQFLSYGTGSGSR